MKLTCRGFPMLILLLGWAMFMHSPAQGQKAASPDTPEGTVARYIEALREGSLEEVREVFYPSEAAFYLPGPVNILRYEIKEKKTVQAEDLEGLRLRVPPRAGDVRLDVFQVRESDGRRTYHMFSYWLRSMEGGWKIYAQSAWGKP